MAMASDGNEWELSKENVQPLRQGRVMATLQEALAQQDASSHPAIQQQKREFESEIRFYCGDDPLDVWDRYIRWTEQNFPQGGKESNLSAVLERAVKALSEQQRYYQDPRYLSLWLKFGNYCTEPLDLYSYLHSQEIGTSLAQLYITWAEELEARGNYKKADLIFQDGLLCKAEPLDKLESHHRQFQARVSRQTLQELEEDHEEESSLSPSQPQRTTLAELKGRGKKTVRAPISRVGNAVKYPNQGQRLQNPPSQQVSNCPRFAVFDENKALTCRAEVPVLVPQPWAAPPPIKAKENDLQARSWNMGRRPSNNMDSSTVVPAVLPDFTPYVEESAQQQTMTPCKIESSINCVLSARKPGKEEDPLHRVQSHQQDGQEKKEQPMYCKERVYAGVEEFSLEEIRAEIYRKKIKKKREEELQIIAQKKAELKKKIEEMEKIVREQQANRAQEPCAQQAEEQMPTSVTPDVLEGVKLPVTQSQVSLSDKSPSALIETPLSDSFSLKSNFELDENVLHRKSSSGDSEILPSVIPSVPFSIFDETSALENQNVSLSTDPLTHAKHPLAVRKTSEGIAAKENIPPENSDELHGIEPLSEELIVIGSYRNNTIFPTPEDTCAFITAAHIASTPFHGVTEQRSRMDDEPKEAHPVTQAASLSQHTIVTEDQYADALYVKKLSPIMEASQEDTGSSASSASPTPISTKTFSQIPEKMELAQSCTEEITNDPENSSTNSAEGLQYIHQRKRLLQPLPDFLTKSPDFKLEPQPMPWIELEKEVDIGSETYSITREYVTNKDEKMFSAVLGNFPHETSKAFLIKVHSDPVPWDFFIILQLQERLDSGYDQSFSDSCTCFLYHNGCVTLHKEIHHFTLQDMIQRCTIIPQEVILVIVDNLLDVVAKLHTVEIVHGNIHPATLFLGDRICNSFGSTKNASALKMVDFSHSLDLNLQPRMYSLKGFPIAQTQAGQQILNEKSLPYQVDLIGIANIVHCLLFGECLQVHQEEGYWKTDKDVSQSVNSKLWNQFFGQILNANGKPTVPLLRELREELRGTFDGSFQERLSDSLTNLEVLFFNAESIF